jgi:cysteine synthase A
MLWEQGILTAVGGTPVVELKRLFGNSRLRVFAKLEGFNPGGSAKDRAALQMVKEGIRAGQIGPRTVIIESSSGNMAISMAMICRCLGLRFICVIDPKTTRENRAILQTLGAVIDCVQQPDPATGEYLPARIRRVRELLAQEENGFWPNQYANTANARAHFLTTMPEIVRQLGEIDYLFLGISSCGTLRGCAEYIQTRRLKTKVIAVDLAGSVIFGGEPAERPLPGLGAGIVPPLFRREDIDRYVQVSARECVRECRRLAEQEAILAGGSSGGVIAAVRKMEPELPDGAVCCAILPDRGERYLQTIYNDEWVAWTIGDLE